MYFNLTQEEESSIDLDSMVFTVEKDNTQRITFLNSGTYLGLNNYKLTPTKLRKLADKLDEYNKAYDTLKQVTNEFDKVNS